MLSDVLSDYASSDNTTETCSYCSARFEPGHALVSCERVLFYLRERVLGRAPCSSGVMHAWSAEFRRSLVCPHRCALTGGQF